MTLIHHSPIPYQVAAADAAEWARKKMRAMVDAGTEGLAHTLNTIERTQPQDALIGSDALKFGGDEKGFGLDVEKLGRLTFHPHAMIQAAERIGMPNPTRTVAWLRSVPEGDRQLADICNMHFSRMDRAKFLVRAVNTEVRGFLSDRYLPLQSPPIVKAFLEAVAKFKAMPIQAGCFDTKFFMKAIHPDLYEPIPGEVLMWGINFKNSDFGDGRLEIEGFIHRLRCTNLMCTDDVFSRVHLGGKMGDNIEFSRKTWELQTEMACSAVSDIVTNMFAPDFVTRKLNRIRAAHEEKVDADSVIEALQKGSKISKDEAGEIKKLFSSAEVELLPPGQSTWRLSNALSLFAQSTDPQRALELEVIAGKVAGLDKMEEEPKEFN